MGELEAESELRALSSAVFFLRERLNGLKESREAEEVVSSLLPTREDEGAGRWLSSDVDGGSTAFLLFCSVLVLMMTTPGIVLYYSGLVRLQNALSTAIQAYVITSLITFLWLCLGYSLCFGSSSSGVIGTFDKAWLSGVGGEPNDDLAPGIPEYVYCSFQLAFAVITPSLICGAFANRMKFLAVVVFISLWHIFVYCPIAHCFWHPDGWLKSWGVVDFAGGCVVHISAGFSALISALMIGKRKEGKTKKKFHPHNKIISGTGACFLNVGWFGFNAGSALVAGSQGSLAFLNTQLACGAASISWMCMDILLSGVPSFDGIMNGCIAGLVAVTPCAGFVNTSGAFIVGVLGGAITSQGVKIKTIFGFDDALDAFGIHGIAGVVGVILTGCLANSHISGDQDINGVFYGGSILFLCKEVASIAFTIAWGCSMTAVILKFVDKTIGLRVSQSKELMGLDASEHGKKSSQMQNVPSIRRVKSDDSLRSSNSSNSSGSGRGGEELERCWPCYCLVFHPPPERDVMPGTPRISGRSTSPQTMALTAANKAAHDRSNTANCNNQPILENSHRVAVKKNHQSFQSLDELDSTNHSSPRSDNGKVMKRKSPPKCESQGSSKSDGKKLEMVEIDAHDVGDDYLVGDCDDGVFLDDED